MNNTAENKLQFFGLSAKFTIARLQNTIANSFAIQIKNSAAYTDTENIDDQ